MDVGKPDDDRATLASEDEGDDPVSESQPGEDGDARGGGATGRQTTSREALRGSDWNNNADPARRDARVPLDTTTSSAFALASNATYQVGSADGRLARAGHVTSIHNFQRKWVSIRNNICTGRSATAATSARASGPSLSRTKRTTATLVNLAWISPPSWWSQSWTRSQTVSARGLCWL